MAVAAGRMRVAQTCVREYGLRMSSVKRFQVTFDCSEPVRLARFWSETLGYLPDYDQDESAAAALDPTDAGPRLYFQRVPEGKVVKNRLHLDVRLGTGLIGEERVAVLEKECSRLVELGATRVRLLVADEENESCLVMQDVEGNEFCLA